MGSNIGHDFFNDADFRQFRENLRKETKILMDWFSSGVFEEKGEMCGFELEGWLVNENYLPAPRNEELLERVKSHLVVPELSQYNFEINTTPQPLDKNFPVFLQQELSKTWRSCASSAETMDCKVLMIGILPTIEDRMLTLQHISHLQRYAALNREILRSRERRPLKIHIEGDLETLDATHHDVMAEAATTSLQIHLQVSPSTAARQYNIAQVLSAPMVALTANAPFLFGKELWNETRIPLFEQAVKLPSFCDKTGRIISRVTFGSGYVRNSLKEIFLENLDGFPILLPEIFDEDFNWLNHLRLHNGTIWRWNRPLIGLNDNGMPHLRIEHRIPSAGPSIPDVIANILFFYGAMCSLLEEDRPPEQEIPFEDARKNFYLAAKEGLDARIVWKAGKRLTVREILLEDLLMGASCSLRKKGIDPEQIRYTIDEILKPRVITGKTGSTWQKEYIHHHGPQFQEMTHAYHENQNNQLPVHSWKI
ncbi:hypothetical protein [Prosthecochloris sp.]|uniref:hypothetical protein n=1 Tax=Prosthecochloris sp. TaxID=290513 RepID=UPI0025F16BFA|nr:hypothetical protein [Prosthecochloris sp.]